MWVVTRNYQLLVMPSQPPVQCPRPQFAALTVLTSVPKEPTMAPEQPPPPSPSLRDQLIDLDNTWSLHLHTIAAPVIPRAFLRILELSGDGRFWFPISISLFLSPLSLHSLHLYRTFLSLLLGFLLDLLLIGFIKHLVRRPRPVYNKDMHLTVSVDHWSFPSGHSSRVCFIASFLFLSIGEIAGGLDQLKLRKGEFVDRWIGDRDIGKGVSVVVLTLWIWSILTSVSRVLLGRHYVFDVLLVLVWVFLKLLLFSTS